MKISILSKRTEMFAGRLARVIQRKGHNVKIYDKQKLIINDNLLDNNLVVLKSKKLFFLYAGFFIHSHGIPVYPNVQVAYRQKNRIEAHYLIKEANLNKPEIYLATKGVFLEQFKNSKHAFIQKPIMGSGSRGVKILNDINEIKSEDNEIIYLERYIKGTHYLVYFIGDEIQVFEKIPLADEHSPVKPKTITKHMKNLVLTWKEKYNLAFGHLDLVREKSSGKIFIVDVGCFPEFCHWKQNVDPAISIANIILNTFKR